MAKSKSPKPQAKRPTNQGLLWKHRPRSAERPGPFQIFHCNSWLLRWDNTCRAGRRFREHSTGGEGDAMFHMSVQLLATRSVCEFQGYHLWSDDEWHFILIFWNKEMPKKHLVKCGMIQLYTFDGQNPVPNCDQLKSWTIAYILHSEILFHRSPSTTIKTCIPLTEKTINLFRTRC